ncbi:sugar phosphate isomerase/epimerase family protein [Agriterribacter sp.]|uniref:sugar phosphate isomerase/epimerase family protein n=1 Tax=Agriterribacter sp. TaxID=2821509 RepID=UPI002C4C4B41|nr:sugar phosphate isomerase/epimerase family protein [Agriterribacter sp.]HTN08540.1 sugar phosphate isomerase/epimerase family protein [Agriterribacter sp.]
MKSAVTIALVPQIKSGPWVFWENIEDSIAKAAALGFNAVELFTASATAVNTTLLQQLLETYHIRICAVGTGAGKVVQGLTLTDADADVRARAIAFISEMIDFGAAFSAPAIIGSMQGNIPHGTERAIALQWLGEGISILANKAVKKGVRLIYEPLNRYETNIFNCFADAVAWLKTLDTNNIQLLADLFHMNIEEASIPETIYQYGSYIGHVHFADSNRRAIGMGHTPMSDIAKALQSISYSGYLSAEVFPLPNSDAAARQTINAFNTWFK